MLLSAVGDGFVSLAAIDAATGEGRELARVVVRELDQDSGGDLSSALVVSAKDRLDVYFQHSGFGSSTWGAKCTRVRFSRLEGQYFGDVRTVQYSPLRERTTLIRVNSACLRVDAGREGVLLLGWRPESVRARIASPMDVEESRIVDLR